jgi:hypothetical protein
MSADAMISSLKADDAEFARMHEDAQFGIGHLLRARDVVDELFAVISDDDQTESRSDYVDACQAIHGALELLRTVRDRTSPENVKIAREFWVREDAKGRSSH